MSVVILLCGMAPNFEEGQRERHNLVLEEFHLFEFEKGDGTEYLCSHDEARPIALNGVLGAMSQIYSRVREEYIGSALGTENSTVFTLFEPEGVWVLEYHDEDRMTVQLKQKDRDQFLENVDSQFMEKYYEKVGIDPQEVIEEGKTD